MVCVLKALTANLFSEAGNRFADVRPQRVCSASKRVPNKIPYAKQNIKKLIKINKPTKKSVNDQNTTLNS